MIRFRVIFGLLGASAWLAACQTTSTGSIAGGECRIFERPPYAVRGLRPYDQDWIDSQVEGGVGGCGWARPEPRPASVDAVGTISHRDVKPTRAKRSLLSRVRSALKRKPRQPAAEVPPAPDPEPALPPPPPAQRPPPPPDPVDQLLDRSGPAIRKFQDRVQ